MLKIIFTVLFIVKTVTHNRSSNLNELDQYANIPLLAAAAIAFLLFIFLLIGKIRNSTKASVIMLPALLILTAGLLYSYFNPNNFILITTVALAGLITLPCLIVVAVGDAEKRAKKRKQKQQLEDDEFSPEAKERLIKSLDEKYQTIISKNNEMTAKVSSLFTSPDALEEFMNYINKELTDASKADGCVILMLDEYDNILSVKSLSGSFPPPYKLPEDLPHKELRVSTNFKYAQFQLTDNIFGNIVTEGKPCNIINSLKDKRIFQNKPEEFLTPGPYIFIPRKQDEEVIGVIGLARTAGKIPFSEEEFNSACVIANSCSQAFKPLNSFISYAEHSELTKEGDIASKFQKTMLPEKMPVINKLSIGKHFSPAENVVGDFYDIIPSRKDRITFVMADIAGKGMTSLVIMIMVRAMIRLVSNTNQDAATILEWVNKAICSELNKSDRFGSIALINYNSVDDTAQIATCGINPVIVYSAKDQSISKISSESEPIGVDKGTQYKNIDLKLSAGDVIVTCTDGLVECLNESGAQYSIEKLENVIKHNCQLQGKDIANKIKDDVKKHCGTTQQYDDQSLLVAKIQG